MASTYKRPASEIYQCQFYVTDPVTGDLRKVRKSTGQTNKKKAQAVADELERAAQGVMQAGSERAKLARAILAEAVLDIEREAFTAPAARKYLFRLLEVATGETLETWTLETWSAEWIRRKSRDSAKATIARHKSHVAAFLDWLGEDRRRRPLESVTPQHMAEWRDSLQDSGRAGKSVLYYLKVIGSIYLAAIREGITTFNPCGTAIADVDTNNSHSRKPFVVDEVGRLADAAPSEQWRGLVLVAAFTGLRLGDAARLSWSSVDLDAKRIALIPSKTRKKKVEVRIPIHPDLLAYLLAAPVHDDSPAAPVFPDLSNMAVSGKAGLSAAFVALMAAAGVDRGKPSREVEEGEEKGVGRITWEKGFHSFRHTFTSWLRHAGVSEEDRMDLTGHSTRENHQIYSHADEKAGQAAIAKLPSLNSKKEKP
jgi:integrase